MSQPIRGQGGHFVIPIGLKTQTLSVCFLSSFVEFRSAVSEEKLKMSQPIRGQGGHLVFSDRPEKHLLGRGRWDLPSCKVSSNSGQWFQKRSRKCEKLTTTDGRRTTHDHNSALEPSAQVHLKVHKYFLSSIIAYSSWCLLIYILIYCFYHLTYLWNNFYGLSALVGCWSSAFIRRIIYKLLNVCPFDYTAFVVSGKVGIP